jgi:hypothetical protein
MVRPLRLDAWRGDQTVQGYAVNILALFFALRPENRSAVLDLEYIPRGERPYIPDDGKSPTTEMMKLPSDWEIGDPF